MAQRLSNSLGSQDISSKLFMHRAVHIVLTLVMLWLSYVFMDRKDNFGHNQAFSFMASVATESDWGYFALSVAMIGMASAYTLRGWVIRTTGAAILAIAHLIMAFSIACGRPDVPSVGLFVGFAVLGGFLAYSSAYVGQRLAGYMEDRVEHPNHKR